MMRSLAIVILATVACGGIPPKLGGDGRPVFRADAFPRAAGDPFWCFRYTSPEGNELTSCHESQAACATQIRIDRNDVSVLSGCTQQESVVCMTYYFRTGTNTVCAATPPDCEARQNEYLNLRKIGRDQLTACTAIDTAFPPGQE